MEPDELIRRINNGDALAIEDLLKKYHPAIRRIMVGVLRTELSYEMAVIEAEEAEQELCMDLLRKGFGEVESSFENKLWQMARNKSVDRLRQTRKGRAFVSLDVADLLRDRRPDQEAQLSAREASDELRALILKFTPQNQQLLNLYITGHSYQEIAHLLGIPVGTVKVRLFRAKKKLRGK